MGCTNFTIKNIQEEELMRETQSGRTKGTISRGVAVATLGSFLFVVLGWMLVVPAPATAGVAISDKLSVYGDVRVRYEQDREDRTGTNIDRDRDRARFRARFGFKHKTTDKITVGMRFATEADSLQSPHQTMGVSGGASDDFGIDRAYIETKWGKGGFLWLGKHGISFWEQNEQFWDGDIQPEGVGAGYKFGLGDDTNLLLQSTYTYINDEGWATNRNNGINEDDTGLSLQGVLTKGGGTAAIGTLMVNDDDGHDLAGGSADYYIGSVQYKTKAGDLPIKLGADYLWSDDLWYTSSSTSGPCVTCEDTGYVLNASTKKGNMSFQFKHYDIGLNSVPLQGAVSQDNFRFSSNFEGQRYQVGYNFGNGVKADFRIYDQDQKYTGTLTNAGGHVQNSEDNVRYQVNLNAKF